MKQTRNSSIEVLRMLAILGIVIMHTNGTVMEQCSGWKQVWIQIENGFFNAGVSIFVLISGYFGIKCSVRKLIELETTVIFYAVISAIIGYYFYGEGVFNIIKSFIPISTNRYWFISYYILLMIFSTYINKAADSMNQQQYMQLLILMSMVFLVIPTFVYYSILGSKNVINMLLLYFLGAYIRRYNQDEKYDKRLLLKVFIFTTAMNIMLNLGISILVGGKAHIPFARDCSVFIVIEATALFMIFLKYEFHSNIINIAARHVFAVYLFEGAFRQILEKFVFDYNIYGNKWYWPLISIAVSIVTMSICMAIDVIVQRLLEPLRKVVLKLSEHVVGKIKEYSR